MLDCGGRSERPGELSARDCKLLDSSSADASLSCRWASLASQGYCECHRFASGRIIDGMAGVPAGNECPLRGARTPAVGTHCPDTGPKATAAAPGACRPLGIAAACRHRASRSSTVSQGRPARASATPSLVRPARRLSRSRRYPTITCPVVAAQLDLQVYIERRDAPGLQLQHNFALDTAEASWQCKRDWALSSATHDECPKQATNFTGVMVHSQQPQRGVTTDSSKTYLA